MAVDSWTGISQAFRSIYFTPARSRRVVFVGVTVGYDALSGVVLYLVSAALVGFAFDQPLPLFSVIPWILASRLGYTCIQWSTPNRIVQWVGSFVVYAPMFILLQHRVGSPPQVELSITENAVMILVGVVSFALTVVGVARQRRGDFVPVAPRSERSGGYPVWFVSLFRFPCPTTSPTRAQVWFELKSSGLPVLSIGLAMAVVTFLLYAISIVVAPVRPAAVAAPIMFGLPILLLYLGGNAFGIRRRQGRTYVSAFEATQPYNTAQLASVKLLVRTACVLAALIVVGVSLWASSSLMSAWTEWIPDGQQADAKPGLLKARQEIGDAFGGLTAYALAVLPVVMSVAVALVVASLAAFTALRARYFRRLLVAGSLLLLFVLALVLLAWAVERGIAPEFLLLRDTQGDRLDRPGSDGAHDYLPHLERLRGPCADGSLRVRRSRDRGGNRGDKACGNACRLPSPGYCGWCCRSCWSPSWRHGRSAAFATVQEIR